MLFHDQWLVQSPIPVDCQATRYRSAIRLIVRSWLDSQVVCKREIRAFSLGVGNLFTGGAIVFFHWI